MAMIDGLVKLSFLSLSLGRLAIVNVGYKRRVETFGFSRNMKRAEHLLLMVFPPSPLPSLTQHHSPPPAGRWCSCSWSSWRWRRRWWESSSPPEPPARTPTRTRTPAWWSCQPRKNKGQNTGTVERSPGLTGEGEQQAQGAESMNKRKINK